MFSKTSILGYVALMLLSASEQAMGRIRWLERDNHAVHLNPRRFGQENPAVIQKISEACDGAICGNLSGQAITPLLAAQGECTQQDMADDIIDAAAQFDEATAANMIALAIEYRQVEKNTPPDFTTNPPTPRNSVFCQKAPRNAQLIGLVQAQDPANDPTIFFDPATKATVLLDSQRNTRPFGGDASASAVPAALLATQVESSAVESATATPVATEAADPCVTVVTVTVTSSAQVTASDVNPAATPAATSAVGDFGSCTIPQIEFAAGFDNRKETSFQPADLQSFNHGSAQAIGLIARFICDTLTNSCGADQAAKDTCATATAAADTGAAKTGEQADLFNAAFGVATNFAAVQAIDDQGRPVASTGSGDASAIAAPATLVATPADSDNTGGAVGGIGDFGSCSVPEIAFAAGFDNRKETSFQPADLTSYNHGSAQNIRIIAQFICDTLVNSCGADATAQATCASAETALEAGADKTGEQADLFNAAFGITTNLADVTAIDNQGNAVGGTGVAGIANDEATTDNGAAADPAAEGPTDESPAQDTTNSADNLQTFTGALGGVAAPTVTASADGKFQVEGNASFNNQESAVVRSCDVQNNQCANAANAGNADISVSDCNAQQSQCIAQARA